MDDLPLVLTEHDDHWVLPFRGLTVTQIFVDFAFGLNFDGKGEVRIGGIATLGWAEADIKSEELMLNPERQDVVAGLSLFNTKVRSAVAFKSGTLRVEFGDGHLLRVEPDPQYEAWSATGPGGMLIVSLPGGELAVWLSRL